MQIILISLLITSGCLVALFTFKMQYLQTVNYKQNVALKDLRLRYSKFTDSVVSLRSALIEDRSNFADTDLNVELQVKKVTKLLDLLNVDLALINKNANIKGDNSHEIFKWLNVNYGKKPKWNFYKYLFNREGKLVESWSSITKPDSNKIKIKINELI